MAWDFWGTAAATIITLTDDDSMATVYAEILLWGVSKAAKKLSKLDSFELYLGNLLVGYRLTLRQILDQ